jgi:hypothetical protein
VHRHVLPAHGNTRMVSSSGALGDVKNLVRARAREPNQRGQCCRPGNFSTRGSVDDSCNEHRGSRTAQTARTPFRTRIGGRPSDIFRTVVRRNQDQDIGRLDCEGGKPRRKKDPSHELTISRATGRAGSIAARFQWVSRAGRAGTNTPNPGRHPAVVPLDHEHLDVCGAKPRPRHQLTVNSLEV